MNPDCDPITVQDVWLAKRRIERHVTSTPLHYSSKVSDESAAEVYLKLENLHETGAFKIRGAANKILSLSAAEQALGVTTFSTGNHGLAVAVMAKTLGIRAVICISNRVPTNKVERLEKLGAEVVKVGNNQDDAEKHAYELEQQQGLTVIPPFDDREVIAGQGTIGLELIEAFPELEVAIIPVSGGGLFAGIALVLKHYIPNIRLVGVSMERSPVMYESIRQKQIVTLEEEDTLADSLLGGIGTDNYYTYELVKKYIDDFVLLTEAEIARAMSYMLTEHQLGVEGAAATGVAVLQSKKIEVQNKRVAAIVTGRNIAADLLIEVCQKNI